LKNKFKINKINLFIYIQMKKIGLNQKNTENILSKCFSLKIMGTQPLKNEIRINRNNSIINKFKFSESEDFENKKQLNNENKTNLKKANNKILNIISNCMEKIQDEKTSQSSITPHLAEVIEKHLNSKEQKRKNKKIVTFNSNNVNNNNNDNIHFHRNFSKKSQKSKNSLNKYKSNIGNPSSNNFISNNILSDRANINKNFHRIRTTSHLLKEKEKEIVYNISSSLMLLYKSKQNYNISNDKNKLKNIKQRRNSYCLFQFGNKKNNNTKRSSKDKTLSNISNDSQIIKKPQKPKKFPTFIMPNCNKIKIKKKKNQRNSKVNKSIDENLFFNKTDLFNTNFILNKNSTKRDSQFNKKTKNNMFNVLNWTNDLKNKENLTEGEYVHIQQDIKESLIHFNKKQLEEEMKDIENTETTNLVRRLPTMKNKNSSNTSGKNTLLNAKFNNKEFNSSQKIIFNKEKFRLLQHTGYVYDSLDDEEVEDAININNYYINPNSIYIFIFDSIITIISFYCLFYFPYYLAHDSFIKKEYINFKTILFYLIDTFYILDLIISFFRAYYNYDEILIKNIFDMSSHYVKNWFFIDFLAAIPFFSIIFFYEKKDKDIYKVFNNKNSSFSYFGVKINKIYYLLIINKLLKIFKCFSNNNRAFSKFIQILFKNDIIEEKSGLFLIIFILLAVCNFGTCVFIFIGRNSYPSWLNTIRFEETSFKSIYICSLYYLITTITTVGYGDIYGRTIQEIIFQIILLMIGTCTYSYLISSVSNFIKKINEKSLIFENKLNILKEIKLSNPHMKENLYDKLLRFLRYKKNTEKNKQTIIINSLPYSLKNLLIIEMYKPIINNFIIFKGLENSNCIVQLVTAFKPIYAIKNDILIQEGDFIEEVIFVKTGVISLEIGIDFNKPKESIIQYLNRNNEKNKNINQSNYNIFNTTYGSMNTTCSFLQNHKTTIKNDKKDNKNTHYLKVLDIRKNEHFGETLMFLNERSFLTVKVKSKKAELFFLKKEEVIKIFNAFPNIWNRINKKSIYNMKQIKIIVNKVLLNFCSMIGININDEINQLQKKGRISIIKKKASKKENNPKIKEIKKKFEFDNNKNEEKIKLDNFNKNIDFSLSIIKSERSLKEEKNQNNKEAIQNKLNNNNQEIINNQNRNNILFSTNVNIDKSSKELLSIYSRDNSIKLDTFPKSTKFSQNMSFINSHKLKNHSNSNEINDVQYKKRMNNIVSCFKEEKNNSSSNSSINIDIRNDNNNKEDNYENNGISSKETVKMPMNKKVCSLIDSESLEEKKEPIFKDENFDVNNEIYINEKFNLDCEYKDDLLNNKNIIYSYLNNKIKIEDLSQKILEKTWIQNLDKEKFNYIEKLLNKSKHNSLIKQINTDSKDESMISSSSCITCLLSISNNESFEIKALYENINNITNNKYIKNISLRNKTKEFLLKECRSRYENDKKISESKISSDNNFFKNLNNDKKNNINNNGKIKKKEFEKINKTEIILKRNSEKKKKFNIRSSLPSSKMDNNSYIKKFKNSDNKLLKHNSNNLLPYYHKIKNNKLLGKNNKPDKGNRSYRLSDEKEMSFYDKYNLSNLSNLNLENSEGRSSLKKRKKHDSEFDEIKNIIKQDAQNLNHPDLYYQKLFLNQIQKRKEYNKTLLPIDKNANNLSLNLRIRRISTSNELNNINNNLNISLKRNNQKSCLNISSKLKKI